MKIAFLGFGNVGGALAANLQTQGHHVTLAADNPQSKSAVKALAANPNLQIKPTFQALDDAEIVFLALPYPVVDQVLRPLADALAEKILIDCTNPVGPGLSHGLESKTSGSQTIAAMLPRTQVIKAFTIYGFENFEIQPEAVREPKPAMLFCGDQAEAKQQAAELIEVLGWEPVDVGGLEQALHLEHMTLLWIRMVRIKGASALTTWARVYRA